jgi:hypothetical protein
MRASSCPLAAESRALEIEVSKPLDNARATDRPKFGNPALARRAPFHRANITANLFSKCGQRDCFTRQSALNESLPQRWPRQSRSTNALSHPNLPHHVKKNRSDETGWKRRPGPPSAAASLRQVEKVCDCYVRCGFEFASLKYNSAGSFSIRFTLIVRCISARWP